jgi:signal transduction histidine kinase
MLARQLPRGRGEIRLSQGSETGPFDVNRVRYPFLLECDAQGRVLWMDENTRAALGHAENLIDTVPSQLIGSPAHPLLAELCLTRIWEGGGRILLGARPLELPRENAALLRLEGSLLRNYIRLQAAERILSIRARERRGGGSRNPIQQIEAERQRLGRELHTHVGQLLSAIRLQLELVTAQLQEPAPGVQKALDRISILTADALERVRTIAQRLHPPEWQRFPIEAAIRQMWDLSGIPENFDARLEIEGLPYQPELDIKVLLYRAAQEAVSNIVRHSRATRVEASLQPRDGSLVMRFQDNGAGFDVFGLFSAPPSLAGGIGLRTIREQAESVGGILVVESGPDGTKLELTVPFQPASS